MLHSVGAAMLHIFYRVLETHCAEWCHDFPILCFFTPLLDPSISIRLGPRPREGGVYGVSICM